MTDTVKAWIEERRGIHASATEGPWENDGGGEIGQHWSRPEPWRQVVSTEVACMAYCYGGSAAGVENADDAAAIVDAHNNLPRALNALEQVLELHKPVPIYDVEAGDCEHGEDCVGIELEPSETYCPDHIAYYSCACMMDASSPDEFPEYPCPTVQAIEGAINND